MAELTPALFERVPRGLFGPLGDPYAELYWELLAELYRHEFEREPFVVVRSTALDVAEAVIRASRLWSERRQDLEALALQDPPPREPQGLRGPMVRAASSGPRSLPASDPQATGEAASIRALARRLVARLEDSGWMHFQYRAGVGEIMSFHDNAALENAAEWYAAQRGTGQQEGRLAVKSELAQMRSHFDNVPQLVDDIDARNARFSGVALRKIRYFLRQDRRTEGQLQFIIDALARDEAPELEFDAFRCELLWGNFLYTPPVARARAAPQRLVDQPAANREQIRREAAGRVRRLFARRRVEEFVLTVLDGRRAALMSEIPVHNDQGYVRLLYLASYGLDGASTFRMRPSGGRLQEEAYGYPDGTLEALPPEGGRRRK